MFEIGLGIVIGLAIGWFFIPQPQWVKDLFKSD